MATTTFAWQPLSHEDYGVIPGKDVFSRDGEKVGSVKEVWHPESDFPASRGQHYFLLDPGLLREWFGGFDKVYLPESAISDVSTDRVVLNLTKDEVKQANWTATPADWARYRAY
jgi:hypothetical protein